MSTKSTRIRRLPIRLVLCYVAATLFTFAFGPFDWPVDNWPALLGFLTATMLALWLGFRWAVTRTAVGSSFDKWRLVIALGAAASLVILMVAAPVYTGRMPWQVLDALREQGAAYEAMQKQLELTAGSRGPIALARVLTWPLVFAVLPFGLLHWAEMATRLRLLMLTTIGCIAISSILRGTDREIADLMPVARSPALFIIARRVAHEGLAVRASLPPYLTLIAGGLNVLLNAPSHFPPHT